MIKDFIVAGMILSSFTATTIAQPIDYVSELASVPAPQNYLYSELPQVEPFYDMTLYKHGQILDSEKMMITKNVGFADGYCTSYVANQRPDIFGGRGENLISGDAKDWLENAQDAGLDTGTTPQVGAIAVFKPGKGALARGHVAIVEYVGDNGLIVVKDMNFKGKNIVTTRVIRANLAQGYIY